MSHLSFISASFPPPNTFSRSLDALVKYTDIFAGQDEQHQQQSCASICELIGYTLTNGLH